MNTKDFQRLIDENDTEVHDMNRRLVFVRGQYALPWKVTERTYDYGRTRRTERLLQCLYFTITDKGEVQYGNTRDYTPREIDPYKSGYRTMREEYYAIRKNQRNNALFRDLMYNSPWSPDPDSPDNPYSLRTQAEARLTKAIREALHDKNCLDDYSLGVEVYSAERGHVTVSFQMTLEEVEDLLKQKAGV